MARTQADRGRLRRKRLQRVCCRRSYLDLLTAFSRRNNRCRRADDWSVAVEQVPLFLIWRHAPSGNGTVVSGASGAVRKTYDCLGSKRLSVHPWLGDHIFLDFQLIVSEALNEEYPPRMNRFPVCWHARCLMSFGVLYSVRHGDRGRQWRHGPLETGWEGQRARGDRWLSCRSRTP